MGLKQWKGCWVSHSPGRVRLCLFFSLRLASLVSLFISREIIHVMQTAISSSGSFSCAHLGGREAAPGWLRLQRQRLRTGLVQITIWLGTEFPHTKRFWLGENCPSCPRPRGVGAATMHLCARAQGRRLSRTRGSASCPGLQSSTPHIPIPCAPSWAQVPSQFSSWAQGSGFPPSVSLQSPSCTPFLVSTRPSTAGFPWAQGFAYVIFPPFSPLSHRWGN